MSEKTKRARCRFAFPEFGNGKTEWKCLKDETKADDEKCEACGSFDSKYIEYPLTIQGITNTEIRKENKNCGHWCEVSPCAKEYNGKSYLGIYLGKLPVQILTSYTAKTGMLENGCIMNPAIFVPELNKIIYGFESFWRLIDSPDDFKGITEEDINNTWYVQMLKGMCGMPEDKDKLYLSEADKAELEQINRQAHRLTMEMPLKGNEMWFSFLGSVMQTLGCLLGEPEDS